MATNRLNTVRRGSFKTGCLIAVGVIFVILVGAGIFVATQWKNWAATGITAMSEAMVQQAPLPQDQKDQILTSMKGVADDFKAGKITTEQLGSVMKEVAEGPILPASIVMAVDSAYLKPSGLPQEEKDAGKRTIDRFARGIYERKFTDEEVHKVLEPVSQGNVAIGGPNQQVNQNRNYQLKQKVNDAELRDFLARAKTKADEKQVPDEAFNVDVAAELDKAIKKALGR